MPLSEDEQRILSQIEQRFHEHDPRSARRLQETTLPRYLRRNCVWGSLAFLLGLIILLAGFASSWIVGIVGFVVMTAAAIVVVHNLRRMGRHGMRVLATEMRQRGVTSRFSDSADRFRRRFDGDN